MSGEDSIEVDRDGKPVVRGAKGRWLVPPKSPGRPKGSQADKVRALIEPHRAALIDRALELTSSPEAHAAINAIRVLLERLAPLPKHEAEKIELPALAEATTARDKAAVVVAAVAAGQITVEASEKLLRILESVHRVAKLEDLEQRLERLEGKKVDVLDDGSDLL